MIAAASDQPFPRHVSQFRINRKLQVAFDLHQRLFDDIVARCTRHEGPLGTLVNVLVITLAYCNIYQPPKTVPYSLQPLTFFFERATSTEKKIDLQQANFHRSVAELELLIA